MVKPFLAEIKKYTDKQDDVNVTVDGFFGNPPNVVMSLATIKASLDKQDDVVDKFVGTPRITSPILAEINKHVDRQRSLNVNEFILEFLRDTSRHGVNVTIDPRLVTGQYSIISDHIPYQ